MSWLSKNIQRFVVFAPLISFALASLAGAVFSSSFWWAIALLVVALVFSRSGWRWRILVALLAGVTAARTGMIESRVARSHEIPGSEFVEGVLTMGRLDSVFEKQRIGLLKIDGEPERKVMVMRGSEYLAGDVLEVKAKMFSPDPARNPGEFSLADYWKRQSIHRGISIVDGESVGMRWRYFPFRWAEKMKVGLQEGISVGLAENEEERAIIQAMVLGEKPSSESEISQAFRKSGAMHVFAVSGLHVTLVGGIAWLVLLNTPVPRRAGVIVVLLVMIAYALITGARPPAVRATLMAICFLGAFVLRRRPSLFNALSLSLVLAILWDPTQVNEVGFQLSYGVLTAIGLGVGLAYRVTGKVAEVDPFFPMRLLGAWQRRWLGVRKYFAALGATSLAAWLGSLPFMFWHFGIVTPISVFASLVLIPLTTGILGLAFLGAFLSLLSPEMAKPVNRLNGLLAKTSFYAADGFAAIPFGHWQSPKAKAADWVVFDPADGGAASYLNVGDGVMIDVGSEKFFYRSLKSILRRWGGDIGTIALTHPDGDHVGAAHLLLEQESLKKAILPTLEARSPSYRDFLDRVESKGCDLVIGERGEKYVLGEEVWLEVIREGQPESRGIADNRIMVMKVHWNGWKVLVLGDLGLEDELALLNGDFDLAADVVFLGRHAHGNSINMPFLKKTGAKAVITSAGTYPPSEKPPRNWIEMVEGSGIEIFNQAETGAVLMDFEKDELLIRAFLDAGKSLSLTR